MSRHSAPSAAAQPVVRERGAGGRGKVVQWLPSRAGGRELLGRSSVCPRWASKQLVGPRDRQAGASNFSPQSLEQDDPHPHVGVCLSGPSEAASG